MPSKSRKKRWGLRANPSVLHMLTLSPVASQIQTVADAMQQSVPSERRGERSDWRNRRLLALHKQKISAEQWPRKN